MQCYKAKELKAQTKNGGAVRQAERIMVPHDDHVQTPGTCDYVTLHGKRDLADINKLRYLSWGEYAGLPRWAQWNHKDPKKMEKPDRRSRARDLHWQQGQM